METQHSRSVALVSFCKPSRYEIGALRTRSVLRARQLRERILAALAFVMLIIAWDATLRLDERVSPPRMRVSHGAEREAALSAPLLGEAPLSHPCDRGISASCTSRS